MNRTLHRYLKFNLVGLLGMGVQLAALTLFNRLLHGHYLVSTALAIETTLLHNFVWHTRYTWRDRHSLGCPVHDDGTIVSMTGSASTARLRMHLNRFLRFHLSNGLVSLGGNLALMALLVRAAHLPVLLANVLSIAACSAANFTLSHRWAFASPAEARKRSAHACIAVTTCFLLCASLNAQTNTDPVTPSNEPPPAPVDAPGPQPAPGNHGPYLPTAGVFCGAGASTSSISSKPTAGCGVGIDLLLVPIFFEVGVLAPQANRSYLSGYYSVDGRIPLFRPSAVYVPSVLIGYSRLFETGHALDYGLTLSLPRSTRAGAGTSASYRIELRDYWTFANPLQDNILLRFGWLIYATD